MKTIFDSIKRFFSWAFSSGKNALISLLAILFIIFIVFSVELVVTTYAANNSFGKYPTTSDSSGNIFYPTSIKLDKTSLNLSSGQTATLVATVSPDYAENTTVQWTSSDRTIADVEDGEIVAEQCGTTKITATTLNGVKAICSITVSSASSSAASSAASSSSTASSSTASSSAASSPAASSSAVSGLVPPKPVSSAPSSVAVASVDFTCRSVSLAISATYQITANITPGNATNKALVWDTTNSGVATVTSSGLVTAKAAGTAQIHATNTDGQRDTCTVTVQAPASSAPASSSTATSTAVTLAEVEKVAPITELYKTVGNSTLEFCPAANGMQMNVDDSSINSNPQYIGALLNVKIYENGNLYSASGQYGGIGKNESTVPVDFNVDSYAYKGSVYYVPKPASYTVECYAGDYLFSTITFSVNESGYTD